MHEHHRRILIAPQEIYNNKFQIKDLGKIHRIKHVLRLKVNDKMFLTDGVGSLYQAIITNLNNKVLEGYITKKFFIPRKKNSITVHQAILKPTIMDELIEQLSQLSVAEFVPIYTQRSQKDISKKRLERWERISKQQANLSCYTMNIKPPMAFTQAILQVTDGLLLDINSPKGLKEVIKQIKSSNINLFIGPEGDFTDAEKQLAREHGIEGIQLSSFQHVFTSYLATISAVIIISYELGIL